MVVVGGQGDDSPDVGVFDVVLLYHHDAAADENATVEVLAAEEVHCLELKDQFSPLRRRLARIDLNDRVALGDCPAGGRRCSDDVSRSCN